MSTEAAASLYENVRSHVEDRNVAALITESVLVPLAGPGTPISPPTYAAKEKTDDKAPTFAVSEGIPVPAANEGGWYQDVERDQEGNVRRANQVIVDSVASQSGRAETALLEVRALGPETPGIFVVGQTNEGEEGGDVSSSDAQKREALSAVISTWTAAHRQADAWIKFAETPVGGQVWEGGQLEDGRTVKDLIISANPKNGELLYSLFPNSALYGYWLSSGTALRHRMPRAYSSQIVGYGAQGVYSAATMLDDTGGASSSSKVLVEGHRLHIGGPKDKRPSDLGFGPIPGTPAIRSYSCELILQRATISLAVLRHIRFQSPEAQNAALTVLVLMGALGHVLAAEDGFFRSGCALVATQTLWGWRVHGRGADDIESLDVGGAEEVKEALQLALDRAAEIGLEFEDPIELTFSPAQEALIEERVTAQDAKQGAEGDDV